LPPSAASCTGNQFATRSGAIAAGAAGIDPKHVVMHQMRLAAVLAAGSTPT
jgi:hypothetical protein